MCQRVCLRERENVSESVFERERECVREKERAAAKAT